MRSTSLVRAGLRRLGFDVARYPIHTTLTGHLKTVLSKLGVSLVLDVGANSGQFATQLRMVSGFSGRIVSFEPAPAAFARLAAASHGDPMWEVRQIALGASPGELEMVTYADDDWNSFHHIDAANLALSGRTLTPTGTTMCPVSTIEREWDGVARPTDTVFLKSDTQGHDLAVLSGAHSRIHLVDGLLIEASLHQMYVGSPHLSEVLATTADLGFAPTGFFPVSRHAGSLILDEVDLCLIRTDAARRPR